MSKFKVGDKVVRTSEKDFGNVVKGGIYEVSEASSFIGINLVGHSIGEGFDYDSAGFELYVDEDMVGALTPLQAAEAILNGEDLLYLNYLNNWVEIGKSLSYSLDFLSKEKFRRKPKTIIINGVELPSPIDTKSLGYPDKVYGLNFSRKKVYDTTGNTDKGLFWATKEDAQKVLDAMLIPFNQK